MIQDIPATNDSDLQDVNDFSNNVTDAIDTTNSVTDQQKDELHSELVQLCSITSMAQIKWCCGRFSG